MAFGGFGMDIRTRVFVCCVCLCRAVSRVGWVCMVFVGGSNPHPNQHIYPNLYTTTIQTYVVVPDWKVPLTRKGHRDALLAGEKIKEYVR